MALAQVNNEIIADSDNKKCTITSFPVSSIDTSWMTKNQKKFFDFLKIEENRNVSRMQMCNSFGYKSTRCWYSAIEDEKFSNLLAELGIKVRTQHEYALPHNEVSYIKSFKEREEYLKNDIWDL